MAGQTEMANIAPTTEGSERWVRWQDSYENAPALRFRLSLVRTHIKGCLDLAPKGAVRIISICAGDGRDVIDVLAGHCRKEDVTGWLIENDLRVVDKGCLAIQKAGLDDRLNYLSEDATLSSTYLRTVPADVLVLSGVFGNLHGIEALKLIERLPSICRTEGFVVWTRHSKLNDGPAQLALISQRFIDNELSRSITRLRPKESLLLQHIDIRDDKRH